MIAKISRPLALLAALGWISTLLLSLASLAGHHPPIWVRDTFFVALWPTLLGAVILVNWRNDGRILTPALIWNDAIENTPAWMRYAAFGTVFYALGLFAIQYVDFHVSDFGLAIAAPSPMYAYSFLMLWTTSHPSAASNSTSLKES